jgi:polysaccharide biosynthesis/export protein
MAQTRAAPAIAYSRRGTLSAHRCLRAIAFVGAILFWQLAAADTPGDSNAYKLEPGDRITVTVFGQPEVSGDILIDGAGNILMPFVGSIAVKDLTIVECQKLITDKLADGIFTQPSVNVRISELRPVYVLGDVRTPGAYPYRYGITAKGAVALAGGFAVTEQSQSVSDLLLAEEHVRELTFQRQALLVREARLQAQRDGNDTFAPPSAPNSSEESDVSDLFAIEKETLDSQTSMLKTQLDLMRSQQPRLQAEIDALNSQVATEARQLQLVSEQVDEYSRLVKKGLGLQSAELQLRLEEASHESNRWRLTAEISRLQRDSGDLSLRIHEAETAAKKQVMDELRDVRQRLKELDVTLPSAREVREIRRQQAGNVAGVEVSRSIEITRARDGASLVISATDVTPLEPGDIVEIKRVLPTTSKTVALQGSATGRDGGVAEVATAARPMSQQ